ncbi:MULTISPECIES: MTH1187 family thiamine-binding protein [unclassified Pseudodesulfovibrio]|uniref:MTH1187 family thiamine-binding protein n=1 Tax=unclassified Pseudodesulfovibrio TaxID=2661612 RepID=UPI000FEB8D4C|nr:MULTISPECIES: MTH1187 family thiamine-binding protein [unclassified Pseudodesulfovibrio]MCJ2165793.1 MTH1187 family thiamine-binding protein [Pseudodesulfovibrio sp. S3-i]RWU02770.1 thiamine-binding protein [Pseudodesulfovibrio sp. S3]
MSVIIDLAIFPMDKGASDLGSYVARALDIIRQSGLSYALGPMGTSIEGEWEDVMAVVDACYRDLEKDSDRIYLNIKADSRKGRLHGLAQKVQSVTDKQK